MGGQVEVAVLRRAPCRSQTLLTSPGLTQTTRLAPPHCRDKTARGPPPHPHAGRPRALPLPRYHFKIRSIPFSHSPPPRQCDPPPPARDPRRRRQGRPAQFARFPRSPTAPSESQALLLPARPSSRALLLGVVEPYSRNSAGRYHHHRAAATCLQVSIYPAAAFFLPPCASLSSLASFLPFYQGSWQICGRVIPQPVSWRFGGCSSSDCSSFFGLPLPGYLTESSDNIPVAHTKGNLKSTNMETKGQFGRERNLKTTSSRQGRQRGNFQPEQFLQVPKANLSAASGNIDGKFEDRIRVVKNDKIRRQGEPRNVEGDASLKSSKPWPARKTATVDELVKHMSKVPSYLQRKETADHLQDKALNVGVLEWGLLARWSHEQKHELSSSHGASPSDTSRSALFSSPSNSSASPSSKSLDSNQSPPLNDHQHCSMRSQQSSPVDKHHEKVNSPSLNSAVLSLLPGHGKYPCAENNGDYRGLNRSKLCLPPDSMTAASGSCMPHEMVEDEDTTRKVEDVVHHCSRRLFTDDDNIGRNFFTSYDNDSTHVMETERNGSRSPVGFLEDIGQSPEFPQIPHSCPLPIMDSAEEPATSSTTARVDFVSAAVTRGENCNRHKSATSIAKKPPQISSKFSDMDVLPDRHFVSGLNRVTRCSSLKEAPSPRRPDTSVDKIDEDKRSSSKGRRSPLRRMLDPLLKSRQTSTSVPVQPSFVPKCHLPSNTNKQSLILEGSGSQNVHRRSVDAVVSSNNHAEANINQPPRVLLNSERYLQQERDSRTTRQVLLQLAWKNGLPLFMLSFGDSDILAATVRRKSISDKEDLESAYTLFTVEEPKKKSGAWITTANKNKKHQLVSSIVGELRISRRKSRCFHTKDFHVHREFVLVGSELLPTPVESGDSHISREIGAFISTVPQIAETRRQSSSYNSSQSSSAPIGCSCPPLGNFHANMTSTNSAPASVIAILPNGFHGAPTSGQPLPLMERWRSGGSCDCGGWDEGCMLSVLTDNTQENKGSKSIQENQTQDGSHRFDLLTQGRSREDRHAFSMVSFKEGLYAVEFSSSIALLQAFAMCIVMLHGRCPVRPQADMPAPQEHTLLADQKLKAMAASQGRARPSYVPHQPPLSPVGRA